MEKGSIVVIDDDGDIRGGIRLILESEGYQVREAGSGPRGLALLTDETDLVILDMMMPGMSGIKTCESIRKISNVPVLFLTARTGEPDKMMCLMAGGDDYLQKPFSYTELLGRVRALLRRYRVYYGKDRAGDSYREHLVTHGNIRIDTEKNRVEVEGKKVELPDLEYRILLLMMQSPGRVFPAKDIYEKIWKEPYSYASSSTVMVHIRNIRVKVEKNPGYPKYIRTVWGRGYKFEV